MKFIQSRFRSPWRGVVIDRKHRTGCEDLYLILILKDRNGNFLRKRKITTISQYWTKEVDKFDISLVNPDWFKNLPILK